ncbi:putative bifunctional diguanylate cyclase/phosphodiesterase [Kushneria indalinina]|uniref:Diguanylate cyclase/phosphodiesterase with PAS/PAC sensor(S) n=1 Tax=Kushneria indalinina DSM 14324 TaxID=1122140 RepID=A0A3D9DWZ7_9GAMM|nr:EAL domain-containing protein [Kushneria indalinina]REC95211.1 diguanylate cyclase/phosphodiesterase with PAS/PAC sensor(s) [Kushneria indalinina DSM 14324]
MTESQAHTSAMTDSDALYRQLVQNITDHAIYMLDPEGMVLSWNEGARAFKGYCADDIVGQHFSCFYTLEERHLGIPLQGLAAARMHGRHEAEGWRLRKDGSAFWASVAIDAIVDQGELIGFAKITRDITQKRAHQQEVLEARDAAEQQSRELSGLYAFLHTVIHNIPTRVMVEDLANGRLLLCNHDIQTPQPGARTLLSYLPPDALLARIKDELPPAHAGPSREIKLKLDTREGTCRLKCRTLAIIDNGQATGQRLYLIDDVTEEHTAQATIHHMAHHDALTNLPNRLLFGERTRALLEALEPDITQVGMLLLDLDDFKNINDVLGHQVGDELLCQLATRLHQHLHHGETLARIGGDEFALLVPKAHDDATLSMLASTLVTSARAPFQLSEHRVQTGISLGGVRASRDIDSFEQLMRCADLALYEAKRQNKGRYEAFRPELAQLARARLDLENDLRGALAQNALFLLYQPIYDITGTRTTGFKALMRWRHPVRGIVSPLEFIPIAENSGLILEIGAWALVEACREASRWPDDQRISVNLSPAQFKRQALVDEVAHALAITGITPSRLELEITESILLDASQHNIEILHQLKQLGVRIVLDDFGTGYSSLHYLGSFPFDRLKIDQSFIREMCDSREALAIVRAVTGMGKSLEMEVTAEGVERREQMALLQQEGCSHLQGFLLGRPGCPTDIAPAEDDQKEAASTTPHDAI